MTAETGESWDDFKLIMLMQFECRMAGCSTQQDQRRRMLGCRDVVWCVAARDLHEPQSGELHEWKWLSFSLSAALLSAAWWRWRTRRPARQPRLLLGRRCIPSLLARRRTHVTSCAAVVRRVQRSAPPTITRKDCAKVSIETVTYLHWVCKCLVIGT